FSRHLRLPPFPTRRSSDLWMRFSNIAWTKDSKGFFYSRYPEPPKNKVLEAALAGHAVYYHRVGTPQSQDTLVYERKDRPRWVIEDRKSTRLNSSHVETSYA